MIHFQVILTPSSPPVVCTLLPVTPGDGQGRREGSGAVRGEEAQPTVLSHPTAGQLDSGKLGEEGERDSGERERESKGGRGTIKYEVMDKVTERNKEGVKKP